jgi:hypothetical protein
MITDLDSLSDALDNSTAEVNVFPVSVKHVVEQLFGCLSY